MISFKKVKKVFSPDWLEKCSYTHTTCPTILYLEGKINRVYFQSRDKENIGRIFYFDAEADNPNKILAFSSEPVLSPGLKGSFDHHGVFPCSVLKINSDTVYLYYVGFKRIPDSKYELFTGLAISKDNGLSFIKHQNNPILDKTPEEQELRGGPSVILEDGLFKMWYVAGSDWVKDAYNKIVPLYSLKYMESHDGINWPKSGKLIKKPSTNEHGFGRPLIYRNQDSYEIIYSVRNLSTGYSMRMAKSDDGLNWEDYYEFPKGASDDDQHMSFGAFTNQENRNLLYYNGNEFGKSGMLLGELL